MYEICYRTELEHNTEQNFNTVYEIWLLFYFIYELIKKTLILHIKVIYFLKSRPFHPQRKRQSSSRLKGEFIQSELCLRIQITGVNECQLDSLRSLGCEYYYIIRGWRPKAFLKNEWRFFCAKGSNCVCLVCGGGGGVTKHDLNIIQNRTWT